MYKKPLKSNKIQKPVYTITELPLITNLIITRLLLGTSESSSANIKSAK